MNRNRLYGPVSLGVMATGSVVTEVLSRTLGISHPFWQLLGNGFHAGLVGALADWYAVHVLLHPAPLFMRFWPFKKHSDLIIRNRPKLEQNIVCMVQDDLLAPDKIWGHLERYEVFGRLLAGAHDPKMVARLVDFVQSNELLVPLAEQVDRQDIAAWLDQLLHEHLGKASIGKPLGEWVVKAMERGEQQAAWESIHNGLTSNINSPQSIDLISKVVRSALLGYLPTFRIQAKRPDVRNRLEKWLRSWLEGLNLARLAGTAVRDAIHKGAHNAFLDDILGHLHGWVSEDATVRAAVRKMLEDAIASYKREVSAIQRWFATFLEWAALDKEKAVGAIVGEIANYVRVVQQDRSHTLRKNLQEQIQAYAEKLATGDKTVLDGFEKLRKRLLAVNLEPVLEQLLTWVVDTLESELKSTDRAAGFVDFDAIARSAAAGASTILDEVRKNPEHFIRTRVDGAIRMYATRLAAEDPEATAVLERLKMDMIRNAATRGVLQSLLEGLKNKLRTQLADRGSLLWDAVRSALAEARNRFLADREGREKLLAWLRPKAKALLEQNHAHIGAVVEGSLRMFTDAALVRIVDDKFGDDLQFVRLNGAVLGFLIGVILSASLWAR